MSKTEEMEELKENFIKGCKKTGRSIEEIGASIYCGADNDEWIKIPAPRMVKKREDEAEMILVEGSATIKNPVEASVEGGKLTVKSEDGDSLSLY